MESYSPVIRNKILQATFIVSSNVLLHGRTYETGNMIQKSTVSIIQATYASQQIWMQGFMATGYLQRQKMCVALSQAIYKMAVIFLIHHFNSEIWSSLEDKKNIRSPFVVI